MVKYIKITNWLMTNLYHQPLILMEYQLMDVVNELTDNQYMPN
jgi:hypothetical protein